MAVTTLYDLARFEILLMLGFLINGGYAVFRKQVGLPLGNFLTLERDVRRRLLHVGQRIDNEDIKKKRLHLLGTSRKSEQVLRIILRLASAWLYVSAIACLALLITQAFVGLKISQPQAIYLVIGIIAPIPLTLSSLRGLSAVFLSQILSQVDALAAALSLSEAIKEESAHLNAEERLHLSIEQIERALEK